MSYKYLNEHPRAYYRWNVEENGSFRGNEVKRAIVSRSRISHTISTCNRSSFSTNTAYNAIDKREKKDAKKKEKNKIRYSDRESNLVVIFRILIIVYHIT